ncbi:hypothetical protein QBC43DRAFT_309444, partial [Cladorrhinum sp. PSN259]
MIHTHTHWKVSHLPMLGWMMTGGIGLALCPEPIVRMLSADWERQRKSIGSGGRSTCQREMLMCPTNQITWTL